MDEMSKEKMENTMKKSHSLNDESENGGLDRKSVYMDDIIREIDEAESC